MGMMVLAVGDMRVVFLGREIRDMDLGEMARGRMRMKRLFVSCAIGDYGSGFLRREEEGLLEDDTRAPFSFRLALLRSSCRLLRVRGLCWKLFGKGGERCVAEVCVLFMEVREGFGLSHSIQGFCFDVNFEPWAGGFMERFFAFLCKPMRI